MDGWPTWEDPDADAASGYAAECPSALNLDDRRLHVRLYKDWAARRHGRAIPSIRDMAPGSLDGAGAILLDLRGGGDPVLVHAGTRLRKEGGGHVGERVSSIPPESLLAKLAGHYPAVVSAGEPIAFEGEHVRPGRATILYRGILLPLSEEGDGIGFIHGVMTWRAIAGSEITAGIAFEVGRAFAATAPAPADADCAAFACPEPRHPELPLGF